MLPKIEDCVTKINEDINNKIQRILCSDNIYKKVNQKQHKNRVHQYK